MQFIRPFCFIVRCAGGALAAAAPPQGGVHELLNVSYDVSRELYKDLNPVFSARWRADTGQVLTVTMNQGSNIDLPMDRGLVRLVPQRMSVFEEGQRGEKPQRERLEAVQ